MKRALPGIIIANLLINFNPTASAATATQETKMANSTDDISKLAPEFMKLTKETLFGDIWKRPGLTQREKSLVVITTLAALNRTEQIDYHLGFALDNGLTQEEIVATFTHLAFYAGWPAAMVGLTHLNKVLEERKSKAAEGHK